MTALAQPAAPTFRLPAINLTNPVRMAAMDAKDIGRRIRTARAWADISQPELAEMLEVSESTVSRWEQGKKLPKRSELYYIAELTGVDRNWFDQETSEAGITALDAAVDELERTARQEARRQGRGRSGQSGSSSENR